MCLGGPILTQKYSKNGRLDYDMWMNWGYQGYGHTIPYHADTPQEFGISTALLTEFFFQNFSLTEGGQACLNLSK